MSFERATRGPWRAAAALGLLMALSGCAQGEPGGGEAPQVPAATSATSTEQLAPTPTPTPAAASTPVEVVITAAGTELALGEKAVVPAVGDTGSGAVGLTVTGIEAGTTEELESWEGYYPEEQAGLVSYYLRMSITNESGDDLGGYFLDGAGISPITDPITAVTTTTGMPGCEAYAAGAGFNTAGAVFDTCVVALLPPGAAVSGVTYSGTFGQTPGEPDYAYAGITWRS